MPIPIRIPTNLRKLTADLDTVQAEGETVGALLADLDRQFPGIRERLCDENGKVRRFVGVYLNDEDIRFLGENDTPVKAGDELSIVPAIAGG
jgi:molybdopterin synthase sulfur carrier subunit